VVEASIYHLTLTLTLTPILFKARVSQKRNVTTVEDQDSLQTTVGDQDNGKKKQTVLEHSLHILLQVCDHYFFKVYNFIKLIKVIAHRTSQEQRFEEGEYGVNVPAVLLPLSPFSAVANSYLRDVLVFHCYNISFLTPLRDGMTNSTVNRWKRNASTCICIWRYVTITAESVVNHRTDLHVVTPGG
jgi:hypothetical protein